MIYLPIICIGIDYIIDRKNPLLFSISIAISLLSNFYFFYMVTILMFVYAVFSFLSRPENRCLKKFAYSFFKCTWYYLLGIGIACIIFVPVAILFLSTARAGDTPYIPLFYTLDYYAKIFGGFASMNMTGYWSDLAFAVPSVLGIICLFFMDKSKRLLKILFILLTIFLCIPYIGSIMNGFSYISNRWIFGYAFLIAYIFVDSYPHISKVCSQHKYMIGILILFYIIFNISKVYLNNVETYVSMALLVICFLVFICFGKKKNIQFICVLAITLCSLGCKCKFSFLRKFIKIILINFRYRNIL